MLISTGLKKKFHKVWSTEMLARDSLRLFASRNRAASEWINHTTKALMEIDESAQLLNTAEGLNSLAVAARLRELIPDEHFACRFESIAEQDEAGSQLIEKLNPNTKVTLHLGYGPVAFKLKLEAAWFGWKNFARMNTDAYNACIYPEGFNWFVVRSGKHFVYPMNCDSGDQPFLEKGWLGR